MIIRLFAVLLIISNPSVAAEKPLVIEDVVLKKNEVLSEKDDKDCQFIEGLEKFYTNANQCKCNEEIHYPQIVQGLKKRVLTKVNQSLENFAKSAEICKDKIPAEDVVLNYEFKKGSKNTLDFIFNQQEIKPRVEIVKKTFNSLNFSKKDGEIVRFSDLVEENKRDSLNKYVQDVLSKDKRSIYNEDKEHLALKKELPITDWDNQTFYIKENSAVVLFKPYVIAPFVHGVIEIELPKELLKPEYFK